MENEQTIEKISIIGGTGALGTGLARRWADVAMWPISSCTRSRASEGTVMSSSSRYFRRTINFSGSGLSGSSHCTSRANNPTNGEKRMTLAVAQMVAASATWRGTSSASRSHPPTRGSVAVLSTHSSADAPP